MRPEVSQRLQIARIVKRRLFIGTKAGSASSISFGLLPDWTRWWWARLKFSGRPKRRTRGRVLPEQRGLICTACSSARFALQSRSAHTRKLRAAQCRLARSRLILPTEFSVSSAIAKFLYWEQAKRASARRRTQFCDTETNIAKHIAK